MEFCCWWTEFPPVNSSFPPHDPKLGWKMDSYAVLDGIKLSEGKHVLTLLLRCGGVNLSHIDFQLK